MQAAIALSAPTLWISCESARAIRDRGYRAIRDPILVLSGTKILKNPCISAALRAS
jgi:hypothetical protein